LLELLKLEDSKLQKHTGKRRNAHSGNKRGSQRGKSRKVTQKRQ
jgi:hypothetical protein